LEEEMTGSELKEKMRERGGESEMLY